MESASQPLTSQPLKRRQACDAKRHLVRAGQQHESLFVLLKGVAAREWILDDGTRQIVGLHVPGDVCGLTTPAGGCSYHGIVALSPVSYISVPRHLLSVFALGSAEFSQAVWRELSREAEISAAWIVNLGRRSAYQRIAHLMCELEARLRAAGYDTSAGAACWPGNQADIGAATGLSIVHVNRTLRSLETDRLISAGRCPKLQDITKLGAVAGFDPSYLAVEGDPLGEMLLSRIGVHDEARREDVWRRPNSADRVAEASSSRL